MRDGKVTTMSAQTDQGIEVESLERRVSEISAKADWWTNINMIAVVCGIAMAAAVFGSQFMATQRTRELSKAQSVLGAEKDRRASVAIATATEEAKAARLESDRLRALFSWREISSETQKAFKLFTKDFPKGKVVVTSPVENPEAVSYGMQIAEMLRVSGYDVTEEAGRFMQVGVPEKGVRMEMKALGVNTVSAFAGRLMGAFENIGIAATWTANEQIGDTVKIMVFRKP